MSNIDEALAAGFKSLEGQITEKFDNANAAALKGEEVQKKHTADLEAMGKDFDDMKKDMQKATDSLTSIQQKGIKLDQGEAPKTMGQAFTESSQFADFKSGKNTKCSMEFKNTIIGEGGSPQNPTDTIVQRDDRPGIIGGAFRQLRIMDAIPQGSTASNTIHYTRELLFTNNAAETSEGSTKPESVLTFEAVDEPVRTIPHFIKASKQVLDDAPMLQSYIDLRMRYGVNLRVEQQIIAGNGTSPNLSGITTTGNHTDATVVSADNNFDLANRMKYQVIAADYNPDYYMINPADWGTLERLKVGTGDDRYVGADGAVGYINGGLIPTLWGLPVVISNSVTSGTIICMASDATMFWNRQATTVEIFDQNQDDVEKNLLTIRAEARGAFGVFRPAAVIVGSLT